MNNPFYALLRGICRHSDFAAHVAGRLSGGVFTSRLLRRIYRDNHGLDVGIGSYGCFNRKFNYGCPMTIGNYCSFAEGVRFIPGNHPVTDVSTHPFFHREEFGYVPRRDGEPEETPTVVGHDVWIGQGSIILPRCKHIGNGAVIGAGSVVTHDVEPYAIIAGNPARFIRRRFTEEQIAKLEASRWYERTPEELADCFPLGQDVDAFTDAIVKKTRGRNDR